MQPNSTNYSLPAVAQQLNNSTNATSTGLEYTTNRTSFANPASIELNNKGSLLINLDRYNESISYFDKALAIDPSNDAALNNKGFALESQLKIPTYYLFV